MEELIDRVIEDLNKENQSIEIYDMEDYMERMMKYLSGVELEEPCKSCGILNHAACIATNYGCMDIPSVTLSHQPTFQEV